MQSNSTKSSNPFGIYPNSGLIYLKEKLDRETKDKYEVTVGATDNGTPADTATAKVIITVMDANDNDPKFNKDSYDFSVEENLAVGAFVGKISAVDADYGTNAVIRYNFIPGNSTFRINPSTGKSNLLIHFLLVFDFVGNRFFFIFLRPAKGT